MLESIENWLAPKLALIPFPVLLVMSVFMFMAPISPEPHFVQKFNWIMSGTGFKPIDVFDVFWHLLPSLILLLKLVFQSKHAEKD